MIKIETNMGDTKLTINGTGAETIADFTVMNTAIIEGMFETADSEEERDYIIEKCRYCFEDAVKLATCKFEPKLEDSEVNKFLDRLVELLDELDADVKS